MHVAVIGAGAIGALVADAAAGAGHDVTVGVRTPITSLTIEHEGQAHEVPAKFLASPPADASPADAVFVTVKVTDNPSIAGWLSALCSPSMLVVAVQNGLDHAARLAPYAPAGVRIVPGLAYLASERLGPGRIRHMVGNRFVVPADTAPAVSALVEPGLDVEGADDMVTATWQKLLGNLVANPITALTLRRTDVFREAGIAELARGILDEAVAVGRACGAGIGAADIDRTLSGLGSYGHGTGSSMLYDRLAGRPTEHQYLTGEVVRRGVDHGIPTPLNSALLALLDAITPAPPPA